MFYVLVAIGTVGGTALSLIHVNPIKLLVVSAVINGLAAAPFLLIVMLISNDHEIMGDQRNRRLARTLGWSTTALMTVGRSRPHLHNRERELTMAEDLVCLRATAIDVRPGILKPIQLKPVGALPDWLCLQNRQIEFTIRGWYEVLLTVEWDPTNTDGTRFAHTAIPDHHPLHSEAIDAAVLGAISAGRQLLRGNAIFDPDGPHQLSLEVWHNAPEAIAVGAAALDVRALSVPT